MDALKLMVIFLVCSSSAVPMIEEGEPAAPDQAVAEVTSTPSTTSQNPETLSKDCTTSRGGPGSCVIRATCEYSTSAIDLSLYAPHGYVKTCKTEEVCCPLKFIVSHETANHTTQSPALNNNNDDSAFEFDDDD